MNKKLAVLVALLLMSLPVFAQEYSKGHAYVFFAPGYSVVSGSANNNAIFHFGGGGEGFLYKGLALGGEAGYVAPTSRFSDGIGLLSVNGAYHFRAPERKVVPFITGGYSLAFRDGSLNGMNFGGGATYWMKEKIGLRLEFRDNYFPQDPGWHQLGFRIGLSFR